MSNDTAQKYQTNLTKEELEKWTRRLRDPNSKQAHVTLHEANLEASCCLGHLALECVPGAAINASGLGISAQYAWTEDKLHTQLWHKLQNMNDGALGHNRYTLPQIADWIDEHLLPLKDERPDLDFGYKLA